MQTQREMKEKLEALQSKASVRILAMESSCDETAAAIVENGRHIVSSVIFSQVDTHALYGGVVPEIASRAHMDACDRVIDRALQEAGMALSDVDALAVTYGPGLVGALLTGVNCMADLAYQSFLATKNLYGKASGTWFYHYTQSFSPQEHVTPAEAHQIAQELAERFFPDCEVLVATHIDRVHLHSHLVVNSVKPDTGDKLHFTPRTLERMRLVSDQICREHGLTTLKPYRPKKQVKGLRPGEYRSAMRGQSWKFQLIAVIEAVMEHTGNREEFLNELRRRGYDARWEEGRRSITYITPAGMRCRDDKLHEEKFRKEKIEDEFRIRQRAAQHDLGQAETADAAYADRSTAKRPLHHADNDGGAAGGSPAEDPGLTGDHPGGYGDIGHQGKSEGTGHRPAAGGLAESDQQHPSEDLPGPGTDGPGNKGGTPTG